MARPLRAPLLLLASLAVTLAVTLAMTLARSSKPVGGIKGADVNDEGVQRELDFATSKYNEESNDSHYNQVQQIVSTVQQVLFRLLYSLYMELSQTTCNKSQANLDNCRFQEQPNLK
nr:cystatin-C-like isoform X2 [Microcebus murinus]